jgi:hypothetical protein
MIDGAYWWVDYSNGDARLNYYLPETWHGEFWDYPDETDVGDIEGWSTTNTELNRYIETNDTVGYCILVSDQTGDEEEWSCTREVDGDILTLEFSVLGIPTAGDTGIYYFKFALVADSADVLYLQWKVADDHLYVNGADTSEVLAVGTRFKLVHDDGDWYVYYRAQEDDSYTLADTVEADNTIDDITLTLQRFGAVPPTVTPFYMYMGPIIWSMDKATPSATAIDVQPGITRTTKPTSISSASVFARKIDKIVTSPRLDTSISQGNPSSPRKVFITDNFIASEASAYWVADALLRNGEEDGVNYQFRPLSPDGPLHPGQWVTFDYLGTEVTDVIRRVEGELDAGKRLLEYAVETGWASTSGTEKLQKKLKGAEDDIHLLRLGV